LPGVKASGGAKRKDDGRSGVHLSNPHGTDVVRSALSA
jgi:hypothetical protein